MFPEIVSYGPLHLMYIQANVLSENNYECMTEEMSIILPKSSVFYCNFILKIILQLTYLRNISKTFLLLQLLYFR